MTVAGADYTSLQELSVTGLTTTTVGEILEFLNIQLEGAYFYINSSGKLACRTLKKGSGNELTITVGTTT